MVLALGAHLPPLTARLYNHKLALRPRKPRLRLKHLLRPLLRHRQDQIREGEAEDLVASVLQDEVQQGMMFRGHKLTEHLVGISPARRLMLTMSRPLLLRH